MDPTKPPIGRARGRARGNQGVAPSGVQAQRPGEAPQQVQAALLGRGRGMLSEGPTNVTPIHAGRSNPRVATQSHHQIQKLAGAMASATLSSSGSDVSGANSRGDGSSSPSDGNGNGQEAIPAVSVARGARRGRPADVPILRTCPDHIMANTKKATDGTQLSLKSNFFPITKLPNWRLYQYRVDFKPEIDYTREKKYHVRQNSELKNFFFDGTILITNQPIDDKKVFNSKRSSDDQIIEVRMKLVGEVDNSSAQYLQFMNIILRSMLEKLNLDLIGRDYYDSKAAIRDPKLKGHKLELYPGYMTSIRQHENDVLLGVEISHKVLRVDSVLDVIRDITQKCRNRANLQAELDKALLGQIVITKYNNKTYKISEVHLDKDPSMAFEDKKGNKVQFMEYYLRRWGMKITDPKQPMIVSIPKERDMKGNTQLPVQLVPELCNMTGLSDAQRADYRLMADVAVYTRQNPDTKYKALMGFQKRINETPEVADLLKKWDLKFSNQLVDVKGRQLPGEEIFGNGSRSSYQVSNADWGNCFRNWKCSSSKGLEKWIILVPQRDQNAAEELKTALINIFPGIGMSVANPKVEALADSKMNDYRAALDKWTARKPEMVVAILPNKNEDLYSMIKRHCIIKTPTPSQCVVAALLKKPKGLMSVATKIALQMNCKLGGQLWTVKIPIKGVMVIGFDTYHDSQRKGQSVGALVASYNQSLTQFFSTAEFHETSEAQELSTKIATMTVQALNCYKKHNDGALPTRIFYYRDGVGDGQIPFVHSKEVQEMKKAINMMNPDTKLAVIITSKRINTRFMESRNGSVVNPNSGTVVDDVVTLPERYDFFLVSQSVRQGTVNPTSYNVIYDECQLPPGKMQILTYKLAHLYYNWPGTVRVPAPVQYAHKLAYLLGCNVHAKPNSVMDECLYYL